MCEFEMLQTTVNTVAERPKGSYVTGQENEPAVITLNPGGALNGC